MHNRAPDDQDPFDVRIPYLSGPLYPWEAARHSAIESAWLERIAHEPHPAPDWPWAARPIQYQPAVLPEGLQDHVESIVPALEGNRVLDRHPSLDQLLSMLETEYGEVGIHAHVYCAEGWVHVVEPGWLAERASQLDPEEHSTPEQRIAAVRTLLDRALSGDYIVWGIEYPVYAEVPVAARDGRRALLACHYAAGGRTTEHPIDWIGAFRCPRAFRTWLRRHGYWTHIDQFDALPDVTKLAFWEGESRP